jgi:O-antigen/teichoic acid export membrane protein
VDCIKVLQWQKSRVRYKLFIYHCHIYLKGDSEMKQKSLIKNTLYNFFYTGMNLMFPIITAPYISRVLGAKNLGKVNFATNIINWFILFAVFGTTAYGIREVAKARDNQNKLNSIFSEIFLINTICSVIVSFIYIIVVFKVDRFHKELPLYLIMALSIILNMLSIDWFYQGIEEYKYITIRSSIFKIISLVAIFLFIKEENNYIYYGLISVLSGGVSGILNFIHSRKFVKLKTKDLNLIKHIKPLSLFFFYAFLVNIYTNFDQTLLGLLTSDKYVAFMARSKSIIGISVAVTQSITNATLPRISYYQKNDEKLYLRLIRTVPKYVMWITIPSFVGMFILSENIMYLLGGSEFLEASNLLRIVSINIIFIPLVTFMQYQVMIPSGLEKKALNSAILTSVLSVFLNFLLIPLFGFIGAGIAKVVSEAIAFYSKYFMARKLLKSRDIKFVSTSLLKYFIASIIMGVMLIIIKIIFEDFIIQTILSVIIGFITYISMLIILRDRLTLLNLKRIYTKLDALSR